MTKNKKKTILVYTDGSCVNNGKKNAVGGIGIYFPNKELTDISRIYDIGVCTNHKAELYAILITLKYIKKNIGLSKYKILIKTDSEYSINCLTKWINGWINKGWKTVNGTRVVNRELIEPIHQYCKKYDIDFEHVLAHTNGTDFDSLANDKADRLAKKATQKALQMMSSTVKINHGSKNNSRSTQSGSNKIQKINNSTTKDESKQSKKNIQGKVQKFISSITDHGSKKTHLKSDIHSKPKIHSNTIEIEAFDDRKKKTRSMYNASKQTFEVELIRSKH